MGTPDESLAQRKEFIESLVKRRKGMGMTQQAVANRMGITQGSVTYIENGSDPRLSTIIRYARAVGVTIEFEVASSTPQNTE